MFPLLLSFLYFLFCTLVGKALMETVGFRRGLLKSWLIAPLVGASLPTLLLLWFNYLGYPVAQISWPLFLSLLGFVLVVFVWKRPAFPLRAGLPFWGLLLFALVLTGWPSLRQGFAWSGFRNLDMEFYAGNASALFKYGFAEVPAVRDLLGYDLPQWGFFDVSLGQARIGNELTLACLMGLTGKDPFQLVLPLLNAQMSMQISALMALLLIVFSWRRTALLAGLLAAFSPMLAYSVYNQHSGQVLGVALGLGALALFLNHFRRERFRQTVSRTILGALVISTVWIVYPEVMPLFVMSLGCFFLYTLITQMKFWKPLLLVYGIGGLFSLLLLERYFLSSLVWFARLFQIGVASAGFSNDTFGSFLTSMGFPQWFGFVIYGSVLQEPMLTFVILMGLACLILFLIGLWRAFAKGHPVVWVIVPILFMAAYLLLKDQGYSLLKLSMIAQPATCAALAIGIASLHSWKWQLPLLLAIFFLMFSVKRDYTRLSMGGAAGQQSSANLAEDFARQAPGGNRHAVILSDDVYTQLEYGSLLSGNLVELPYPFARDVALTDNLPTSDLAKSLNKLRPTPVPREKVEALQKEYREIHPIDYLNFAGHDLRIFKSDLSEMANGSFLVESSPRISLLNKFSLQPQKMEGLYRITPMEEVRNVLGWARSNKSGSYYQLESRASFWQPEPNPMAKGTLFRALGRYHLFRVFNPSEEVRLRMAFTRTVCGKGRTELPKNIRVIGETESKMTTTGIGSTVVFSDPIRPKKIGDYYFVAVDMGEDGQTFPPTVTDSFWFRLTKNKIGVDTRKLVGFASDISLVDDDDYGKLSRTTSYTQETFQKNPANAEYSGVCEDGWMSTKAVFVLGANKAGDDLTVEGELLGLPPMDKGETTLRVRVNGKELLYKKIQPGPLKQTIKLPAGAIQNRVELEFSDFAWAPAPDYRPLTSRLAKVEITSGQKP